MNTSLRFILTGATLIGALTLAAAPNDRQTFRDSMGRNMGSQTTDRSGRTTYRDAMGRITGSSERR